MLRRTNLASLWVGILLVVSILAQMWGTTIANVSRTLLYPMWMMSVPVIVVLFKNPYIPKCGELKKVLIFGCLFIVYCILVHQGVGGFMKFAGTVILCYTTGLLLSANQVNEEYLKKSLIMFVIVTLVLGYFIQTNYIGSVSEWMGKQTYSYGSKNSSGQIMATAFILCLLYLSDFKKKKLLSVMMWGIASFLGFMILMVQCRSAMLGLVIAIGFYLIFKYKDDRKKLGLIFILMLAMVVLISTESVWSLIEKALALDKYKDATLNEFSSGRLVLWGKALLEWWETPMFGTGAYYVDNMYLCALAENGIIGFILLMIIHFSRVCVNLSRKNDFYPAYMRKLILTVKILTVFFLVESFLEGYPPFGPGICSCIYWMLSGYCDYYCDSTNYSFEERGDEVK